MLSFCGRGWFEPGEDEDDLVDGKVPAINERGYDDDDNEEEISMQCSTSSSESSGGR